MCREQDDCHVMEWQMARVYSERCKQGLANVLVDYTSIHGYVLLHHV